MEDKDELKNMAIKFYSDLFTSDPSAGGDCLKGCFPPVLEVAWMGLVVDFSIADTSRALKGLCSLKAPWPDGYHCYFSRILGA